MVEWLLTSWTDRARKAGAWLIGAAALVAAAVAYSGLLDPAAGLYVAGLAIVGIIAYRWPAAAIGVSFAMSGAYGSLKAFFNYPANGTATILLAGLGAAAVGVVLFGRRRAASTVWPGVALIGVLLVDIALMLPFSPASAPADKVARTEGLYMLGFVLIAYGPWHSGTHSRARRAIVWVALGVGAYATLRYAIGASAKERALVTSVTFNQTSTGHDKVQGSFPSGVELGLWTSSVIPFLIATLLTARGRLRVVALAALPLCLIGLFGSGLRSGLIAVAAGSVVVLLVYGFALSMPANRPLILAAVVLALAGGGAVLFPHIVGGSAANVKRYSDLLDPTRAKSYQQRLTKWEQAFSALHGHPFGVGLGTVGSQGQAQPYVPNVNLQLDSSYVRVAYEQGIWAMVVFIAALLLLLAGFIRRGVVTLDRDRAGPAIAAAGTLTAAMILFFSEMFTTAPCALAMWIILGLGVAPFTRRSATAQPVHARSYAARVPSTIASSE